MVHDAKNSSLSGCGAKKKGKQSQEGNEDAAFQPLFCPHVPVSLLIGTAACRIPRRWSSAVISFAMNVFFLSDEVCKKLNGLDFPLQVGDEGREHALWVSY
jgi:hypothetical protein